MQKSSTYGMVLAGLSSLPLMLAIPEPAAAQGTQRERMACMSDAMTHCSSAVPDPDRIEVCLRRNYSRISSNCQLVLGPGEPAIRAVAAGGMRNRP
ncbi:hypothetical protein [Methylobacterium sp. ID0610]|uniref:hypothetical protein n=1 Tax=Methylobacterium carpenticola TaxID=3344827 RepID=UPI00368424D2